MGCGCDHHRQAPALASVAVVQGILNEQARCLVATEHRSLSAAAGTYLAEDLHALRDVPGWDNSAMDGYAIRYQDIETGSPLRVAQWIQAGQVGQPLAPGTCARIFTGAPLPPNADTVIMQEQVRIEGDCITFDARQIRQGDHIRRAGEEMTAGTPVLPRGARLEPAALGLLATQGIDQISVFRPLTVGLLMTGDELIEPGQPLKPGQIYNSNRVVLAATLSREGYRIREYEPVEDTLKSTRQALSRAAFECDVIITTGGVSVGDADHVRPAVGQLGQLTLWKLAIKPGKPFAFGWIQDTPVLGLPGNPMAALLTLELLGLPFLRRCQGGTPQRILGFPVRAGFSRTSVTPRQEYLRVYLEGTDSGHRAVLSGSQSSAVLTSVCRSDGYLIIPPNQPVKEGRDYEFLPRSELYR